MLGIYFFSFLILVLCGEDDEKSDIIKFSHPSRANNICVQFSYCFPIPDAGNAERSRGGKVWKLGHYHKVFLISSPKTNTPFRASQTRQEATPQGKSTTFIIVLLQHFSNTFLWAFLCLVDALPSQLLGVHLFQATSTENTRENQIFS